MKKHDLDAQYLALYDAFVNDIFTFFYSKTWKRALAKELTQETFVKTWNELSHGNVKSDMKSIYTLLRKNAESVFVEKKSTLSPVVQ